MRRATKPDHPLSRPRFFTLSTSAAAAVNPATRRAPQILMNSESLFDSPGYVITFLFQENALPCRLPVPAYCKQAGSMNCEAYFLLKMKVSSEKKKTKAGMKGDWHLIPSHDSCNSRASQVRQGIRRAMHHQHTTHTHRAGCAKFK